jgi:FAD:protein FMN transferase
VFPTADFRALGTGVRVLVTQAASLEAARAAVEQELSAIDVACSRFRPDSELTRLNARAGARVAISPLLFEALEAALRSCQMTAGAVDPTMGRGIRVLGYDRDFEQLEDAGPLNVIIQPAAGAAVIELDRDLREVVVQGGHEIDLGATAKALAADRAARAAQTAASCGVLVSVGGDLAIAGEAPDGGWPVLVTDDQAAPLEGPGDVIVLRSGALATSSTTVRRWLQGGVERHHILDPSTGSPARAYWRTVSVVAGNCVDANAAATASIIWGARAPEWLIRHDLPARLVAVSGAVTRVAGWPAPATVNA